MKKRFIFDENYIKRYAKKDHLKWLVIGFSALVLIIIIIIVILANKKPKNPIEPALVNYEVKKELVVESGSSLPSSIDYFDELENVDLDEIKITYPDEFELSYDTSLCSDEEIEAIYEDEEPNFEEAVCARPYLKSPNTYGILVSLQEKEYTVTLKVVDTTPPLLTTKDYEMFVGEEYTIEDFVDVCYDVTGTCEVNYYTEDIDSNGNPIDYSSFKEVGNYTVKLIATDNYENISAAQTANLIIKAKEGNIYTVKFNTNGGSSIEAIQVEENHSIVKPTNPTKEGYVFVGWYYNNEEFDFNTPITNNITLTAQWEKESSEGEEPTYPGIINVTSISLDYKQIYLSINETKTVTARVYPSNATNKNVTWTSANPSIAKVTNGKITGVSNGTTTITATAGGKSATVTVVVRESSGTGCTYGNGNYNQSYILSVDLRNNGCAVNPNISYNETVSTTDYTKLMQDINNLGLKVNNNSYNASHYTIRNTAGTGIVGYQITISINATDPDTLKVLQAKYIIKSNGTRQFITNSMCKNGKCLQ